jgi:superfamily I DNA/RNA helicase
LLSERGVATVTTKTHQRGADDDAVMLTTFHSSKGLEFPVVILVALNLLDAHDEQYPDEIRLLYVGMTRATEELHLSASGSTKISDMVEEAVARL